MYTHQSKIRKRRRKLLKALLRLETDETVAIRVDAENLMTGDRLNLQILELAIFESGGTGIAATALSRLEFQFVTVLDSAGETGLCIDELIKLITGWNEDFGEENAAVLASRVNVKFRRAKIPFVIKSRRVYQRKFTRKIFFLSPQLLF